MQYSRVARANSKIANHDGLSLPVYVHMYGHQPPAPGRKRVRIVQRPLGACGSVPKVAPAPFMVADAGFHRRKLSFLPSICAECYSAGPGTGRAISSSQSQGWLGQCNAGGMCCFGWRCLAMVVGMMVLSILQSTHSRQAEGCRELPSTSTIENSKASSTRYHCVNDLTCYEEGWATSPNRLWPGCCGVFNAQCSRQN